MKFIATVDKKYTKWDRLTIEFEAQNETEAAGLIEKYDGVPPNAEIIEFESILEADEEMTRKDNGGYEVHELINLNEVNAE